MIKILEDEQKKIETKIDFIMKKNHTRDIELLTSIPGIGKGTASRMFAVVGTFDRFDSSRKLASFIGLTPTTQQSGTSIHSRGSMSRMGGTRIRGALYFCAITASIHNKSCIEMKKRMKAKGKPGKVILVAIMNKLIRQMFAVIKTNKLYDPNYA